MLLNTLGASLLGNLFPGNGAIKAGEGTMQPHSLTNFETQKYYKKIP